MSVGVTLTAINAVEMAALATVSRLSDRTRESILQVACWPSPACCRLRSDECDATVAAVDVVRNRRHNYANA